MDAVAAEVACEEELFVEVEFDVLDEDALDELAWLEGAPDDSELCNRFDEDAAATVEGEAGVDNA